MKEFIRKPCKVKAIQYTGEIEDFIEKLDAFLEEEETSINVKIYVDEEGNQVEKPVVIFMSTLGEVRILYGDYVTKSDKGEILVWEKPLFEQIHKKND